jgi:GNAT superfamily N-acetyltransferase
VIRPCGDGDRAAIEAIVNDGARAYRGVIPPDRWHEPYMSREALDREIAAGVRFWGWEEAGELAGVMGIQDVRDATLIRHAYVRTSAQRRGIGARLMRALVPLARPRLLVGTWADASWAIRFYEKNGFRLVDAGEKDRLLDTYWSIPPRQRESSVVLVREPQPVPVKPS